MDPSFLDDTAMDKLVMEAWEQLSAKKEATHSTLPSSHVTTRLSNLVNNDRVTTRLVICLPEIKSYVDPYIWDIDYGIVEAEHFNSRGVLIKIQRFSIGKGIIQLHGVKRQMMVAGTKGDTRNLVAYLLSQGFGNPQWQLEDLSKQQNLDWIRPLSITHMGMPTIKKNIAPEDLDARHDQASKLRRYFPDSYSIEFVAYICVTIPDFSSESEPHRPHAEILIEEYRFDRVCTTRTTHPVPPGIKVLERTVCHLCNPVGLSKSWPTEYAVILIDELLYLGFGSPKWEELSSLTETRPPPATAYITSEMVTVINHGSVKVDIPLKTFTRSHTQWQFGVSPMSGFSPIPNFSPMSNFSTPASFRTADSPASFMTARSTYNSPGVGLTISTIVEKPASPHLSAGLAKLSLEYKAELRDKELIQPFDKELNWSGKGQHVTFSPAESVPLKVISLLGASPSAEVIKVLCRRVALARKTMRCTRTWTVADALREVYHLQNLRHFHIVQLVGTYLQGRNFSILMYPAADCHLGTFLEDTADMQWIPERSAEYWHRRLFLGSTFGCLASAISFVHDNTTKHMDIKPHNMLVRRTRDPSPDGELYLCWRIYLSDFGLSRSFASNDHSQTDGPTSRTPKYCAPEVYEYESRGRASDIFSLGCVYAEIASTYACRHPCDFADFRRNDDCDDSFRLNVPKVVQWFDDLEPSWFTLRPIKALIHVMLRTEPTERPKAAIVARILHYTSPVRFSHCGLDPEPYIAYSGLPPISDSFQLAHPARLPVRFPGIKAKLSAETWADEIMNNLAGRERRLLQLESIFFAADPDRGCYYQPRKTAASWGYEPPREDNDGH